MAEKNTSNKTDPLLADSDSSDEDTSTHRYPTTEEERQYGTVPGSAQATAAAISHTRAQCNPTVERGPPKKTKTKVKKLDKDKSKDKKTQTPDPKKDK